MALISVSIEGLAELEAAAARAGASLEEDIRTGLLAAADVVADRARGTAPVRSGRLRASIRAEAQGLGAEVIADARNPRDGYPYPIRIERQQPFFAPAVANSADEVQKKMETVLDDVAAKWGGA